MSYMSVHTKAEKLRHAIRMTKSAKDMVEGDFGSAEGNLKLIHEDYDNAIRKASAALNALDALLAEEDEEE